MCIFHGFKNRTGPAGSTGDRPFIRSGSLKKSEFKKNWSKTGNRRFDHKNREPERLNRFWSGSTNQKTTSFWPQSRRPSASRRGPLCLTPLAPLPRAGDPSASCRLPRLPHAGDSLPLVSVPSPIQIATSVLLTGPVALHHCRLLLVVCRPLHCHRYLFHYFFLSLIEQLGKFVLDSAFPLCFVAMYVVWVANMCRFVCGVVCL